MSCICFTSLLIYSLTYVLKYSKYLYMVPLMPVSLRLACMSCICFSSAVIGSKRSSTLRCQVRVRVTDRVRVGDRVGVGVGVRVRVRVGSSARSARQPCVVSE